jgi:hypothetical protein
MGRESEVEMTPSSGAASRSSKGLARQRVTRDLTTAEKKRYGIS